jgi:lysozyme
MLLGIDCYGRYGPIDWARAQASGVRFSFLKCTEGNSHKDPRFEEYAEGCRNVGMPYGPYLYAYPLPDDPAHPGRSPEDQARRFYNDCGGATPLPPVLDIEWPPHFQRDKGTSKILDRWTQWKVDAPFIAAWTLRCLAEIERLFARVPIVYTYPDFWQSLGQAGRNTAFARYPLWIANYTHPRDFLPPDTSKPMVPAPWSDWAVWQFSADGSPMRVPGVPACPLDRNCVRDLDALLKLRPVDTVVYPAG